MIVHRTDGRIEPTGFALTAVVALSLFLFVMLGALGAAAGELRGSQAPSASSPSSASSPGSNIRPTVPRPRGSVRAKSLLSDQADAADATDDPDLRGSVLGFRGPRIRKGNRLLALSAVQTALTEVGDGSTYVWHQGATALTGMIRPIASFQDLKGRICRRLSITLMSGTVTRTVQGKACRDQVAGIWSLERS